MGVIGNVVGDGRNLGFRARECRQVHVVSLGVERDGGGDAVVAIAANRPAARIGQRPVVFDDALERFPGEIEPVELRISALDERDHPERLRVMIEAPVRSQASI